MTRVLVALALIAACTLPIRFGHSDVAKWRGPVVRSASNQPDPGSSDLFLYCSETDDVGSVLHPRDLSRSRRPKWVAARYYQTTVFVRPNRWAAQCNRPVAARDLRAGLDRIPQSVV